jgi:phytol kinase
MPPVAVFVCHLVTTRKHDLTGKLDHRLDAILSHTIACLPWVIAADLGWTSVSIGLAGLSFAMGAQLAILDTATRTWMPHLLATPVRSVAKGLLVASLPGLLCLWPEFFKWVGPAAVAAPGIWFVVLLFEKIEARYHGHAAGLWIMKGLLALAASSPALLISR